MDLDTVEEVVAASPSAVDDWGAGDAWVAAPRSSPSPSGICDG
jgi:hypothetical protein